MGEPARRSAAGLAAPGWGDVRRQMIAGAQFVMAAVAAYLAAGGDDSAPPAAMAAMAISAFENAGATARHLDVGEAVIEEACARAVAADRAARPRPRGGHLRPVR